MSCVRRVLIVKLSAIGDVVQALPVSAALGDAYPHLEMTWVVEESAAPMVEGNPYLKEVLVLPNRMKKRLSPATIPLFLALRRNLRARKFDVALDLQGLSKSALIAWASGAQYRFGYDWMREFAPLWVKRIPRRPESVHVVEQFLDVARFLGAPVSQVKFPLYIPEEEVVHAQALLQEVGIDPKRPYMVINPSEGGGGYKSWGAARWAALLNSLQQSNERLPTVLVGSKADLPMAEAILSYTLSPPSSLVGRTNLKQLAAILRDAAVHLAGDTGSAHIAAALGTPVVSIFGRTNPLRLAPYGQSDLALHHRECCKAVCLRYHQTAPINAKQKCLAPPPRCIEAVTVPEVAEAMRCALARSPKTAQVSPID
jgi:heptosyltransferase-1